MFTPRGAPRFTPWRNHPTPLHSAIAILATVLVASVCDAASPIIPEPDAAALEFVATKVRPLLEARCFECHGPEGQREEDEAAGGLLLDSRAAMLVGGETGPAIKPGDPSSSRLIDAVNWGELEMPPDSKLPDGEIAILTKWVQMGAPWVNDIEPPLATKKAFPLEQRRAEHWAWQALADPTVPAVAEANWPRRPLDHFIAAAREKRKLGHSPDTDRRTLIRRMSYAIIGLPPTKEEVDIFVNNPAPDERAIAELADRLLASPHYGERWGRHWLDLMRYAESRGHEFDLDAANAWQYRDYVIRALNDDLPYDQFVVEHIAGDLLSQPRLRGKQQTNESILATGFWYLGDWVHSPTDIRADEMERVDNQLDVFGRSLLGVTIACARCHDHKFDAISTADYYALAGYLQSSSYRQVRFESMEHNRKVAQQLWSLRQQTTDQLRRQVGQQLKAGVAEVPAYLRAAANAIRDRGDVDPSPANRQLDPVRLAAWVDHLRSVQGKPDDWLSPWSRFTGGPDAEAAFVRTWQAMVQRHQAAVDAEVAANKQHAVIFDFESFPAHDWRQDGYAFGPGPVRVGQFAIGGTASSPSLKVAVRGAAQQDIRWPALTLARGTQNEAGKIKELKRAGRMLRTPSFTIDQGFHYLVRGRGRFQVVVASHRLIQGPLHAEVLGKFDTGNSLQWKYVNCKRYVGERAHIEFVPEPGQPCEIYKVVSGPKPPLPAEPLSHAVQWIAGETAEAGPDPVVRAIGRRLDTAAEHFMAGAIGDSRQRTAKTALVAWMLDHPELLGVADFISSNEFQRSLEDFFPREADILATVRRESATAIAMIDGTGEDEFLLIRGSSSHPGEMVPRRFLTALGGEGPPSSEAGSGRLHLAQQIVDPKRNPLVGRVIVNRVWHHMFGRGIVPSVDNFGVLGRPPSHPELLDYLAQRFINEGWSLKNMIREIAMSRTYRMSSRETVAGAQKLDPDNIYFHRGSVKRLEGEAIRDAILAISGRLDPSVGGRPIPVHLTSHMTGRGRPSSGPLDGAGRRSIYTSLRRNFLSPMMLAFDMPIPFNPVGRRNVSNVPAQPLILMNDPFVVQQAGRWAKQAMDKFPEDPPQRIRWMYEAAYSRPPREAELQAGVAFLKQQAAEYGFDDKGWWHKHQVWTDYAHVLWNVKEFIFIQ